VSEICKSKNTCTASCCGVCCTKIENFNVVRGGATILKNVNIHVHCGEFTALIGPNGAGKSTLLKAILGEVKHTGTLHYLDEKGLHSSHPLIGYVPQYLNFDISTPTSVLDLFQACLIKLPAFLYNPKRLRQRVAASLESVKAEYLIDRRLGALSGGELQRVLLALALSPVPDILLLDEPVSGIDNSGLELFYDTVSTLRENYDLSIILVSHDLEMVAKHADRVILLNGTVVLSGTPAEVFADSRTRELLGLPGGLREATGRGGVLDA
jgi:zinc transport system ATP-binding protein